MNILKKDAEKRVARARGFLDGLLRRKKKVEVEAPAARDSSADINALLGPTEGDADTALTTGTANVHVRGQHHRGRPNADGAAEAKPKKAAAAADELAAAAPKKVVVVKKDDAAEEREKGRYVRPGTERYEAKKRRHRKSKNKMKAHHHQQPADVLAANLVIQANDVLKAWREYQDEKQYVPPPTKGWAGFKHRYHRRKEAFYGRVARAKVLRPCVSLHRRYKEMKKPKRHTEGYRVDDTGPEFPASLMDRASYMQLELWARTHNVTQEELYAVYEAYKAQLALKTHPDESRKLPNRISLLYFQDLFDHGMSEAASLVLLPTLFVKEMHGLQKAKVNYEIDFVRFIIAGYSFARCSPAGIVLKFFRLLLDYHMTENERVYVTVRPFEELVGLIHGGINRPLSKSFEGDPRFESFESSSLRWFLRVDERPPLLPRAHHLLFR